MSNNETPSTESGPPDPRRQWKIDHAGKIDRASFNGLLWSFAIIAVVACFARVVFRLKKQRVLFADDGLVIFATLCLVANTGVMWHAADNMYLVEALNSDPTIKPSLPELLSLLNLNKWMFIYLALSWTSVYSIKGSFLIFFRPLIQNLSISLNRFYWITCVTNILAWMFAVSEPFILCPYFGLTAIKCYPNTKFSLNLGMSILTLSLNIITDIMIVTIPLLLLRLSLMRIEQKARIASFLCLSVSMMIITIVRLAGGLHRSVRGEREFSAVWTHALLHVEAGVAVLMACLVAFRSIFASHIAQLTQEGNTSWYRRVLHRFRSTSKESRSGQSKGTPRMHGQLPEALNTRITMRSLRKFIHGERSNDGMTTIDSEPDPDVDYHVFLRRAEHRTHTEEAATPTIPLSQMNTQSSIK